MRRAEHSRHSRIFAVIRVPLVFGWSLWARISTRICAARGTISTRMKRNEARMTANLCIAIVFLVSSAFAQDPTLPGTALLDWTEEDPSVRVMDGAHAFVEREIAEVAARVPAFPLDAEDRDDFIRRSREALAKKLGVVDERVAPQREFFSGDPVPFEGDPGTAKVAEGPGFRVSAGRWAGVLWVWGLFEKPGHPAAWLGLYRLVVDVCAGVPMAAIARCRGTRGR